MDDSVTLDNGRFRLVVAPERGAGILACFLRHRDAWLPLMPDAREESCPLTWASWLMIPYSNRIENGQFTFDGQSYQLENGVNHAIHGDTRTRVWCPEEKTDTYLRCTFRSDRHENVNWPWPFEARAEFDLMDDVLSQRVHVWNRGSTPMPAGFGFHPYFSRSLTQEGEPVRLRMTVDGVYPDAHDNRIPSGPPEPLPRELDFSEEKAVPTDRPFDICCYGYDGAGTIRWPESGVSLGFRCDPHLTHLVLYNPVEHPYFAVEPVTNANNGVNLFEGGEPTSGVKVLAPGACLEARFDMQAGTW